MALYALTYDYIDDPDLVTEHRPEHRAYLRGLADAGELVLAGPLGAPGPARGLLILNVESTDRVEQIAKDDPFTGYGCIVGTTVQEWTVSIGADLLPV